LYSYLGDIRLKIRVSGYLPPHAVNNLESIKVLPPASGTDHVEVLHEGGRDRKRMNLQAQVMTMDGYNALFEKSLTLDTLKFNGPAVEEFWCKVENISPPRYIMHGLIRFSLTLVETSEPEEGE